MVRALPHGSDTRIDIGRIAAIAAAIALHAAALLMLLIPMAAPEGMRAAACSARAACLARARRRARG